MWRRNPDYELVKLRIENGADVNASDEHGDTALHVAAEVGSEAVIGLLLDSGADVNARKTWATTPLHVAAEYGVMKSAEILLDRGADIDGEGKWTPLAKALRPMEADMARLLVDRGASLENKDFLICLTARAGMLWLVDRLLELGASPDGEGEGDKREVVPLCGAASYEHTDIVKRLLDAGANVNMRRPNSWTPLYNAARFGYLETVRVILDYNPDLEALVAEYEDGPLVTALWVAASGYHDECVSLLLDKGANPNCPDTEDGIYPLQFALESSEWATADKLLDHGTHAHLVMGVEIPLFLAVRGGSESTVRKLLERGSNPNVYSNDFDEDRTSVKKHPLSPLACAMKMGYYDMAEILLDYGADPCVSYWEDITTMSRAVRSMKCSFIKKMLDHGLDVDDIDNSGITPLLCAVKKGDADVVKLLLSHGADPNESPVLSWAVKKGYTHIAKILSDYGAIQDQHIQYNNINQQQQSQSQ